MKKYKVRIKCPDFSVGQIVEEQTFCFGAKIICANYPGIFEEIKEPLFVTQDNIEVNSLPVVLYEASTLDYTIECNQYNYIPTDSNKYFYDKSNAEKWIDENMPRYSKIQIENAIEKSICIGYGLLITKETFEKELGL